MREQQKLSPQKNFLMAVLGFLPEEDNIPWMVENILADLPEIERELLKLRFGLGIEYTFNYEELAIVLKITAERVRIIEKEAIEMAKASRKRR